MKRKTKMGRREGIGREGKGKGGREGRDERGGRGGKRQMRGKKR